jgi:hypothetical protein
MILVPPHALITGRENKNAQNAAVDAGGITVEEL